MATKRIKTSTPKPTMTDAEALEHNRLIDARKAEYAVEVAARMERMFEAARILLVCAKGIEGAEARDIERIEADLAGKESYSVLSIRFTRAIPEHRDGSYQRTFSVDLRVGISWSDRTAPPEVTVNWSACGSLPASAATAYGQLLSDVASVASILEANLTPGA